MRQEFFERQPQLARMLAGEQQGDVRISWRTVQVHDGVHEQRQIERITNITR